MTFESFIEKYNIKLNTQQLEAVQAVEGPVLLLAVPGSGKTTVLVTRLGYMLYCRKIAPEAILTMTYTIAATADMRSRFRAVFGEEMSTRLEFRTINGVCAKIIQSYERLTGGSAFELLSDEKQIAAIISEIYREATESFPTESDIKSVRTLITYAKNMMLSEAEIKALDEQCDKFSVMYEKYSELMKGRRLMDYDDQMLYAYRILGRYPHILAQLHDKYRYICVDEAQDTSKIQHKIISLIAKGSENLFMVGDEDQSIYGFRAAYPEALMNFEKEHEGARVLLMEENFRSNAEIVSAANKFIQKNINRKPKNMHASREAGEPVREMKLASRKEQYGSIIRMVQLSGEETAVLYRDNESALPLIDLLERSGVPYRVKAADLSFFSHRMIQDFVNIIRFAYDPKDTEAFLQIYYKLGTYVSKNSAVIACELSKKKDITVWEALLSLASVGEGTQKGCRRVMEQMSKIKDERADIAVARIFNHMGYKDYTARMNMRTSKISILKAIGANEVNPLGLLRRLDELVEIMSESRASVQSKLILSTIHSSKGLEYDTVCLIDACDGLFPEKIINAPEKAEKEELAVYEEERRLFYVGATRAKNKLYLFTYADESSFFCSDMLGRAEKSIEKKQSAPKELPQLGLNTMEGYDRFSKDYPKGAKLHHRLFGCGEIVSREGDIVTVRFENEQIKRLSLKSLFLQKLVKTEK